jgi:hypothetical protein
MGQEMPNCVPDCVDTHAMLLDTDVDHILLLLLLLLLCRMH